MHSIDAGVLHHSPRPPIRNGHGEALPLLHRHRRRYQFQKHLLVVRSNPSNISVIRAQHVITWFNLCLAPVQSQPLGLCADCVIDQEAPGVVSIVGVGSGDATDVEIVQAAIEAAVVGEAEGF